VTVGHTCVLCHFLKTKKTILSVCVAPVQSVHFVSENIRQNHSPQLTRHLKSAGRISHVTLIEDQPGYARCMSAGGYPPPDLQITIGDRDVTSQFSLYSTAALHGRIGTWSKSNDKWRHFITKQIYYFFVLSFSLLIVFNDRKTIKSKNRGRDILFKVRDESMTFQDVLRDLRQDRDKTETSSFKTSLRWSPDQDFPSFLWDPGQTEMFDFWTKTRPRTC